MASNILEEGLMRTIKAVLQFDGSAYHGWQTQAGERTVQQTVQEALSTITAHAVTVHGAGRTDAGVHALGLAVHFQTTSSIPIGALQQGLNSLLPNDIVAVSVEETHPGFHSRYNARSRTYCYLIWNADIPSPFFSRYSWHVKRPLNVTAMNAAAQHLVGTHDFSAFQAADRQYVCPVRKICASRLRRLTEPVLLFRIQAGSFLKHMVRNILGTLVWVGTGKISPEEFKKLFREGDRRKTGPTAPAHGLFLRKVRY